MKFALALLVICTACIVQQPAYVSLASRTAEQVDSRSIYTTDPNAGLTTMRAPSGPLVASWGETMGSYTLEADGFPKRVPRAYRLRMNFHSAGPLGLRRVSDAEGREFKAERGKFGYEIETASDEFLIASVERSYLESHRSSDVRIRASGDTGDIDFTVPAFYVEGFLRACDRFMAPPAAPVSGESK